VIPLSWKGSIYCKSLNPVLQKSQPARPLGSSENNPALPHHWLRRVANSLQAYRHRQVKKLVKFWPVLRIRDILVRIRTSDKWIRLRILLFSSVTFKMATKNNLHLHHFSKIKSHKGVTEQQQSRFFLLFLLNDIRIRSRTFTCEGTPSSCSHAIKFFCLPISNGPFLKMLDSINFEYRHVGDF